MKISQQWLDEKRREPWYERRVTDGLVAYWIYQHLGNLDQESSPRATCSTVCAPQTMRPRSSAPLHATPTDRRGLAGGASAAISDTAA